MKRGQKKIKNNNVKKCVDHIKYQQFSWYPKLNIKKNIPATQQQKSTQRIEPKNAQSS